MPASAPATLPSPRLPNLRLSFSNLSPLSPVSAEDDTELLHLVDAGFEAAWRAAVVVAPMQAQVQMQQVPSMQVQSKTQTPVKLSK